MRFWCAGSLVSCERNADSLKEKCGFVWTWLRTVRFFAGLNEGENLCAVRYVVMKNVVGSTPCDHVNFSYTDIPTSIESLIDFVSVLSFFFPGWLRHFKRLFIPVWREIQRSKILLVTS